MTRDVGAALSFPPPPADAGPVEPEELRFHFLGGRPCLDLVATVGERWRRRIERLRVPADLDRWLVATDLLETPAPACTPHDLDAARRLRDAIESIVLAYRAGRPFDEAALAALNARAAMPDLAPQLTPDARVVPLAPGVGPALTTIARDAIRLVGDVPPDRIRECAADDCALLFVDTSRPGHRRWCSMRACGNRAKVARHRADSS